MGNLKRRILIALVLPILALGMLPLRSSRAAVRQAAPPTVDGTGSALPADLINAISLALTDHLKEYGSNQRFTVASARRDGLWVVFSLAEAPSSAGDATEADGLPPMILSIAAQNADQSWRVAFEPAAEFYAMVAEAPDSLLDAASRQAISATRHPEAAMLVGYKFLWANTTEWQLSPSSARADLWHDTAGTVSGIDIGRNGGDLRVLNPAEGVVTSVCMGSISVNINIRYDDGLTLGYVHLNKDGFDTANIAIGRRLRQGYLLGRPRPGTWSDRFPTCGNGTAATQQGATYGHIHWVFPTNRAIVVDGWTIAYPQRYLERNGERRYYGAWFQSSNDPSPPSLALANPSFEQGTSGWSVLGPCNYTTYQGAAGSPAHDGSWYLAANRNQTTDCLSIYQDIAYPIQASASYRFLIWVRSRNQGTKTGTVALHGLGGTTESAGTPFTISGDVWHCREVVFTPQSAHTTLRAELYMQSTEHDDFQFDHASLTEHCPQVGEGSSRRTLFEAAYARNGGQAVLGYPVSPAFWIRDPNGNPLIVAQQFENSAYITHDELHDTPMGSVPAYVIRGPILRYFQSLGGSLSFLGVGVTSDQFSNSAGDQQSNFPGGFIVENAQTHTASAYHWPDPQPGMWRAEYRNTHSLLTGPTWVTSEANINHAWGEAAPGDGRWGVWRDGFSVRWTGDFSFVAGDYMFEASADDHVRVLVDGALIIDGRLGTTPSARPMSAGTHQVAVEYEEDQGSASVAVHWSSAPVICTVSINAGAVFANGRQVQLRSTIPGATMMLLSNTAGFEGAQWQPYAATVQWTLADLGTRVATLNVYAKFRDAQGNALCGTTLSDDIVYDPIPPTITVSLVSTGAITQGMEMDISANDDNGSGIDALRLGVTPDFDGSSWQPFNEHVAIQDGASPPRYVQIRDRAGNLSSPRAIPVIRVLLPLIMR